VIDMVYVDNTSSARINATPKAQSFFALKYFTAYVGRYNYFSVTAKII